MSNLSKPGPHEYADYYEHYVTLVPPGDCIDFLENQMSAARGSISQISDEKGVFRYEDGKWSIKEVLGHVIDTERIMAYRALRIARDDKTPIEGFDQVPYIAAADFDSRPMTSIAAELESVRNGTIEMFRNFPGGVWDRLGTASGHPVSVRGLAFILGGHMAHHMTVLHDRYGV